MSVITQVDVYPVAIRLQSQERTATINRRGFTNILVRITTEDGIVGWGEASGASGAPAAAVLGLMEALSPLVVGADIFATGPLRHQLVRSGRMGNMPRLARLATAAFDTACWDAAGRTLNRPVHQLLGGAFRDHVNLYAYPLSDTIDGVADKAVELVESGFDVLYLKVGLEEDYDLDLVTAVRAAVGSTIRLRVDANEAWDLATAKRMIAQLARHDLEFVEQPLSAADLAGARALRHVSPIPIAANQGIWSVADVYRTISAQACDVIVTGPLWAGGLAHLQQMATLCAECGIGFCLHAPPMTSIGMAAALHVAATVPTILRGNQHYMSHVANDPASGLAKIVSGDIAIPTGPGLGVAVDESRVRELSSHYAAEGDYPQVES